MFRLFNFGDDLNKRAEREKKETQSQVQEALGLLEKRQALLERRIEESMQKARLFKKEEDRRSAVKELKRKKVYEEQHHRITTQIIALEEVLLNPDFDRKPPCRRNPEEFLEDVDDAINDPFFACLPVMPLPVVEFISDDELLLQLEDLVADRGFEERQKARKEEMDPSDVEPGPSEEEQFEALAREMAL